jgi:hypothetical protein
MPVPVTTRSKAYVYSRSPTAIVGSNPTAACMFVCCVCCVLSGRGPCDELIIRTEESYRGASVRVIKKTRGRGGHSPRWAAQP